MLHAPCKLYCSLLDVPIYLIEPPSLIIYFIFDFDTAQLRQLHNYQEEGKIDFSLNRCNQVSLKVEYGLFVNPQRLGCPLKQGNESNNHISNQEAESNSG